MRTAGGSFMAQVRNDSCSGCIFGDSVLKTFKSVPNTNQQLSYFLNILFLNSQFYNIPTLVNWLFRKVRVPKNVTGFKKNNLSVQVYNIFNTIKYEREIIFLVE